MKEADNGHDRLWPNDIYKLRRYGLVVEGAYPEVNMVVECGKGEIPVRSTVMELNVGRPDREVITIFEPLAGGDISTE